MSLTPPNPVIALWSHPRSMSTATERIMRERGDCRVFHEPFLAYYYKHVSTRTLAFYDECKAGPAEFTAIKQMLLQSAIHGPVFFKDMSYYVTPRIFDDPEFTHRLHNVFLIRDPRRSIASFYKLDPALTMAELGLDAQWQHYCHLVTSNARVPLVIEAESVSENPAAMMCRLWEYCGLPQVPSALQWQADSAPVDWDHVEGWHQQAKASTSITVDSSDPGTVFEIAARQAPVLHDYLQYQQPFYDKLKEKAQAPG